MNSDLLNVRFGTRGHFLMSCMALHHRDQTQRSFVMLFAVTPPCACRQALGKYVGTPLIGCHGGPHSPWGGSVP